MVLEMHLSFPEENWEGKKTPPMVLGGVQAREREVERLQSDLTQAFHVSFRHKDLSLASPSTSLQLAVKMRHFHSHYLILFISHCSALPTHPPIPTHPEDKTYLAKPLPIQPFITRDRFPILTEQVLAINEFIFHHLDADGFPQEPQGHRSFINRHCKSI